MITNEDFENAEEAIKTIDRNGLRRAEKTLCDFSKKVLAEARRDFLTDKKVVISKMEKVQIIPKITPMK